MEPRAVTTRRSFLAVAGLAAAGLAVDAYAGHRPQRALGRLVGTAGAPWAAPPGAGPGERDGAVRLLAAPATVDLGGGPPETWALQRGPPRPHPQARGGHG